MSRNDDDRRYVEQRTADLAGATELDETEAKAVAWTERGYTRTDVAEKMDTSEESVDAHVERAMALYGLRVDESLAEDEEPPTYERIDDPEAYLERLPNRKDREQWILCVENNRDRFSDERVRAVADAADGFGIEMR